MPKYQQSSATLSLETLYPGAVKAVFNAEAVTTGELSQALALSNHPPGGLTPLGVDLFFSGAPGAFEFDVKFCPNDAALGAAGYSMPAAAVTPTTTWKITQADLDPVNNSVHVDLPYVNANSVAIYVATQPANSVNTTAYLKR